MKIGIDFDNTIICYDDIFHKVACEKKLIPPELTRTKEAVKKYLLAREREDIWTELQGYVYGTRLIEAAPFPGLPKFFSFCRENDIQTCIISHKTRYPYKGRKYDLHAAAHTWLESQGWLHSDKVVFKRKNVFFEPTKAEKIYRIKETQCTHFIDDLPDLLSDPIFPEGVNRLLFDPNQNHIKIHDFKRVSNWDEITGFFRDKHEPRPNQP